MINVIDSIMGSGKTTWCIRYMNTHRDERFVYITPFLEECRRIQNECPGMNFVQPDGFKQDSFRKLLRAGENICTTHALLSKLRFTEEDKKYIDSLDYNFILDEAVEVIQPVTSVSQSDVKLIFDSKWIDVDEKGFVHWLMKGNATKKYKDIATMAKSGTLIWFQDSMFMWLLPTDTIAAMKNLYVMTFLFEASHLCAYLKTNNMPYTKWYIENGEIIEGIQDLSAEKNRIKNLITIYEGKLNGVGKDETALSATKYKSHKSENRSNLRIAYNNAYTYFKRVCGKNSNECIWAGFKTSNDMKVDHYASCFIPFNSKATNKYADRDCLAYMVNIYENPIVYNWFNTNGTIIDNDLTALSTMIQWIWRSAIRNNKPINLYLPSSRMRRILKEWLDK